MEQKGKMRAVGRRRTGAEEEEEKEMEERNQSSREFHRSRRHLPL